MVTAICKTCGGSPGDHRPSMLDPNGIGDTGHRMPTDDEYILTEEDKAIDTHLFEDAFHSWLEIHGVKIGENVGDKFVCTINLNKLKPAIMQLVTQEEQSITHRTRQSGATMQEFIEFQSAIDKGKTIEYHANDYVVMSRKQYEKYEDADIQARYQEADYWDNNVVPAIRSQQLEYEIKKRLTTLKDELNNKGEK